MKHPALVRVFAVVLTIMCLVMSCAGILGLKKTETEYNDNLSSIAKMRADIEEYVALSTENEGKTAYADASEELGELKEKHADISAEHRTELATYTATRGGIKMGTEALDQADAAFANARSEFEAQKKAAEAQKAAFMEKYEQYQQAVAAITELKVYVNPTTKAILEETKENLDIASKALEAEEEQIKISGDLGMQEELDKKKEALAKEISAFEAKYAEYIGAEQKLAYLENIVGSVDPAELEAGKAQFDAMETALQAAEQQINDAAYELYYQRALLWYEIAKLEEQAVELENTKNEILSEEQEILEKQAITEEQKQREKRLKSLYLTYADKPGVSETLEAGGDFAEAVSAYIDSFEQQNIEDAKYRGLANVFMAVAVLAAILVLLGSFEVIKKAALVRCETVLIFMFAAAAMGIFLWLGRGVSYSAMAVLVFAFIQFLVSGKVKKKSIIT